MVESLINMSKNSFILSVYIQTLFVYSLYGSWRDKLTTVLARINFYCLLLFWNNQIILWTSLVFLFLFVSSITTILELTFLVNIPFFRNIIDEKLGPDFVKIYELNRKTVKKALTALIIMVAFTTGAAFFIQTLYAQHHTHVMENAHFYVQSVGGSPLAPLDK